MPKTFSGFISIFLVIAMMTIPGHVRAEDGIPSAVTPFDRNAAVILVYQRIGEDLYPATNLNTEQFNAHIEELTSEDYNIASMKEVASALQNNNRLPDKTVVITFDGAYKSALKNAIPLLLQKNIPFTVFFSPGQADGNTPDYMNWGDLKRLSKNSLVTLGLHTQDYTRLADQPIAEIHRQINTGLARYREEIKSDPQYFAYPFGEYSKTYRDIIANTGFQIAFGQQSGVAYAGSDLMALPRFTMTESYGDNDRFQMAAGALPLPVTDITPDDPHLTTTNPPGFGFTVDESLAGKLSQLSCYISGQGKMEIEIVGKTHVELRVKDSIASNRARLNCTLPGPKPKAGDDQRWRWFGMLLSLGYTDPAGEGPKDEMAASASSD